MENDNKDYLKRIENLEMYKHALIGGDFGILEWNIHKKKFSVSEKTEEIIGYKLNGITNMYDFINIISYEEDTILAIKDLKEYINGHLPFYQSTFRISTKNDNIRWILIKGKIGNNNLLSAVVSDVTENKVLEGCDSLTKIPNRGFFFEKLKFLIKLNKIQNRKGAVIYINIDNFKTLNDNFGNYFGDMVLKLFSQLIATLFCKYGEVARLGGDDFVILIYEFDNIKKIEKICNEIHKCIKEPFEVRGNQIYITASLGVAVFPDDSSDIDELLKFCDFAMYKSKHKGKNMCTFFDKQISEAYFRKLLIESELKNSITNNELYIFYQPQINTLNNEIIGVEALIRWNNNKLENVSPAEFIPIAENIGYITQIGNWVLDKALEMACIWKNKGYKFNSISVNISPIQIKRNDFKDNLLNACVKHNIPPSLLEIEITEGTLVEISKDRIRVLTELIESGVNIAIDDFGTGYSSLNYLTTLPVNTLKIDKSFIDNIKSENNQAVIKSIVHLSKSLKYKIITEGVETKEQMDLLTELGCNIIQGYYFSKPLSESDFENLLKNKNETLKELKIVEL
ncbi:MAG: GGDEF and EAL domain-containing protein [Clostridium sp.]|uniref:bifunctional diguanylate cyclase/phosphodiesterase n=1 Tax=Clostridium sp. TaxID=1506 RepID=UPI0025BD59B3|nr:GGDEF and EAL domain-containing protein [Clostridium sp.]MCE5222131.1 GGDEF and EAL domain-containing protein [Clostridium sp.]